MWLLPCPWWPPISMVLISWVPAAPPGYTEALTWLSPSRRFCGACCCCHQGRVTGVLSASLLSCVLGYMPPWKPVSAVSLELLQPVFHHLHIWLVLPVRQHQPGNDTLTLHFAAFLWKHWLSIWRCGLSKNDVSRRREPCRTVACWG